MKTANAGKVVDKMSLILLLVGLYASTDVIKNKMEIPSKSKNGPIIWSTISFTGMYPQKIGSATERASDTPASVAAWCTRAKMLIHGYVNEESMEYRVNGLDYSAIKVTKFWLLQCHVWVGADYLKWNKLDTEWQILYIFCYVGTC